MFTSTLLDVPRPYIDPIYSLVESLGVICLAISRPRTTCTMTLVLDEQRRGLHLFQSPHITRTSIHHVIGTASLVPQAHSIVVASFRASHTMQMNDTSLLDSITTTCTYAGMQLLDWIVIGTGGFYCPRSIAGSPDPWPSSALFL